jgi:neural Wiskott-Aldrich syndrome protein
MPQSVADELSSIPMSTHLGQSLERAHRFAREQSHRAVTLEHLLLALTDDAEAAVILEAANIELGRLGTEVSGYLGRMPEDMRGDGGAEPRPDGELLRVLQAAASAARQSRRRQIDGAIVLAAIVGDGKTPAAGLLKALGMTFEEAIRALQRANTKARLKPTPKSTTPKDDAKAAAGRNGAEAKPAPSAEMPDEGAESVAASEPPPESKAPQSAEDILAAARARIQRRTGIGAAKAEAPTGKAEPPASAPEQPASDAEESPPAVDPAETEALTGAIQAAMTATAVRPEPARPAQPTAPVPPLQPPAPPLGQDARPTWTPQPDTRPPPPRPMPPLPARLVGAGEGPRRPPLPQPGFPNRPVRAPWPESGERGNGARPTYANGNQPGMPPARERPAARPQPGPRSPAVPRGAGHGEKGLLVEHVPRRMRVGVPAAAEVRIARDRIEGLITTLNGRGAASPGERPLMRALSVRLRAPGGHFWIDPATPETQWVDGANAVAHDEPAIWRWTVVARRRGRGRLALMVSARTVGRDGHALESTPPDRVIEVKVGANRGRTVARWAGWIAALLAGAAIGIYAEQIWAVAVPAMTMALGG